MHNPPESLLSWLDCESFLTKKLEDYTGHAQLKILEQFSAQTNEWERSILGVHDPVLWRRNILMFSEKKACWYARTVIPDTTYNANRSLFARLKNETLGHLIFSDSQITRTSMNKYEIDPACEEYNWMSPEISQSESVLWMRRSTFYIHKQWPFFLMEIFLPDLMKMIETTPENVQKFLLD